MGVKLLDVRTKLAAQLIRAPWIVQLLNAVIKLKSILYSVPFGVQTNSAIRVDGVAGQRR